MSIFHASTGVRVVSIEAARGAATEQGPAALALLCNRQSLDLARLAGSIRNDWRLSSVITQTACAEFGWPRLSLEDAIVLLGARRLRVILCTLQARGRSARQPRRPVYHNRIAPGAKPRPWESQQGELE